MKWSVFLFVILMLQTSHAQLKKLRYQDRVFQMSLVPGVSTNGIDPGWYYNNISINIFGGVSAGSKNLEIAGISNLNIQKTTGIQIAGVANITGANAYINLTLREERDRIVEEEFKASLKGFQIAGITNVVRDDMTGGQFSGFANIVYGTSRGSQVAGLTNVTNKDLIGVQAAGVYNVAMGSVGGTQVSSLANISNGRLAGMQVAVLNKNKGMISKREMGVPKGRSLQIGLINISGKMYGTQVGLINISKEMRGRQVGLINFYRGGTPRDQGNNGVPIGLLNFKSKGSIFRLSSNEMFILNGEYSTGNCLNCSRTMFEMPFVGNFQKFNQNVLVFGYNPKFLQDTRPLWSYGYAFERVLYNKVAITPSKTGPQNKTSFISWGLKFIQLNRTKQPERVINLMSSAFFRLGKKWKGKYWFVSPRISYFFSAIPEQLLGKQLRIFNNVGERFIHSSWPGYSVGVQF